MRRRIPFGFLCRAALCFALAASAQMAAAQRIDPARGVDPRVDYAALQRFGPWDDRNYKLTKKEVALLAKDEETLRIAIPAFFRVELRQKIANFPAAGPLRYPHSAEPKFLILYGGYLIDGKIYRRAVWRNGAYRILLDEDAPEEEEEEGVAPRILYSNVRLSTPSGGSESAIKIHPLDPSRVIAGSYGPGGGQVMHRSTNGGDTWTVSTALPLGGACCDPTVDWSSNGNYAYTATLGSPAGVWFYRSSNGGQTWNDLNVPTPGDPRREVSTAVSADKEFLHVDKFATSPRRDNVYLTWHESNVMRFSRSTDFGNTWSAPVSLSTGAAESGIGSDITSDRNGNVYYVWPAFNSARILVRRSTNGGATFEPTVAVATTNVSFDYPIPAAETRRPFVYVAADTDLSNGPFANRIYLAWNDTIIPESTDPIQNHSRIRVAYSANAGASWTVLTPHTTADQVSVDRFHPWIGVAPDGRVFLVYYDTTRAADRRGVDLVQQVSTNGGVTWSAPLRLTTTLSPHIEDLFQWGDYNGLDIVGNQLVATYTDNRNEGGGAADSVDVYAAGRVIAAPEIVWYCNGNYPGSLLVSCSASPVNGCPPYTHTWSIGGTAPNKYSVGDTGFCGYNPPGCNSGSVHLFQVTVTDMCGSSTFASRSTLPCV